MRRPLLLFLLLLSPLLLAAGSAVIEGIPPADPAASGESGLVARIFASSNLLGSIEPCACPDLPLGGPGRAAALLDHVRADPAPVFYLDAGDRLFRQDMAMLSQEEGERRLKAIALTDIAHLSGLDAWGVGRLDLGSGLAFLRKLQIRARLPVLSANLVDEEGALIFPATALIERGGLKLGVTSVLPKQLRGAGFMALDPYKAAREAVKALREQGAELVVVLSNLGTDADKGLARAAKADLIFGSASRDLLPRGLRVGRTWIGQAGSRGKYLAEARWYSEGKGRGPHLIVTTVPVYSEASAQPGVEAVLRSTLERLADPELGVEPIAPRERRQYEGDL